MWEHFFNWQSDMDWTWGPLLPLHPPRNVHLTLMLWLKLFGIISLFIVPLAAMLAAILACYDYTSAQRYEVRIVPVVVTESYQQYRSRYTPISLLLDCVIFVFVCFSLGLEPPGRPT